MCLWFIFGMVVTTGSGSSVDGLERPGLSDDEIRELITTHVNLVVIMAIAKVFVFIKTILIKMFDERCVVVTEDVVVATTATIVVVGL